jgi:hypothetical protein
MKTTCSKCFKRRKVMICRAPSLHFKGVELCRKCWQAVKLASGLRKDAA